MKIIFNELALEELKDAIDYYNLELPGFVLPKLNFEKTGL